MSIKEKIQHFQDKGLTIVDISDMTGISERTLKYWKSEAKNPSPIPLKVFETHYNDFFSKAG